MRKNAMRKLTLNRESIRQLENREIVEARGAFGGTTQFGTNCHSCHYGCGNYTLFASCTC
jgi:hypothetical protein